MKQDFTIRDQRRDQPRSASLARLRRYSPVALFFLIAFAIDMATGQRYSSVWGSAAIIASVVYLFPAIRPGLVALGGYGAIWVVFNLVRAVADDAGLAIASTTAVARWERDVAGGSLPSEILQDWWFDTGTVGAHDVIFSVIHASFFIVPTTVAGLVWWKYRALFRPYAIATAASFVLGLIGFLLLPTAPPWMSDPNEVTRITNHLLSETVGVSLGNDGTSASGAGFSFEPNHYAALPSVHVSATVLVFLLLRRIGPIPALLGGIYTLLMSFGVVYLGEHFVVDALLGWVIALIGWWAARRWFMDRNTVRWESDRRRA